MGVQKPNWFWKDIWNGLHGTSSAIAKFGLAHSPLPSQSSAGAFHLQGMYQQLSPTIKTSSQIRCLNPFFQGSKLWFHFIAESRLLHLLRSVTSVTPFTSVTM